MPRKMRVDGAGPVSVFFRITVPLLRPVIVFSITLSIIGTFSLFTEPAILFNPAGGPAHSAQTPASISASSPRPAFRRYRTEAPIHMAQESRVDTRKAMSSNESRPRGVLMPTV